MTKIRLKKKEKIVLEKKVNFEKYENINLIITNKRIIFRKEKGLFKTIGYIPMENIKTEGEKVKINQSKSSVTIHTIKDDVTFTCDGLITARIIIENIISLKTGTTFIERARKKSKKIAKYANSAFELYKGNPAGAALGLLGFNNNKKDE